MLAIVNLIKYVVLLCVVPYLNFYYWREYGSQVTEREMFDRCAARPLVTEQWQQQAVSAPEPQPTQHKRKKACPIPAQPLSPPLPSASGGSVSELCHGPLISSEAYGQISKVESNRFGEYKGDHLIQLNSPAIATTILDVNGNGNSNGNGAGAQPQDLLSQTLNSLSSHCHTIVNPTASAKKPCLAIVQANVRNAPNRLRVGIRDEKTGKEVSHTRLNDEHVYQPTGFFGMGLVNFRFFPFTSW